MEAAAAHAARMGATRFLRAGDELGCIVSYALTLCGFWLGCAETRAAGRRWLLATAAAIPIALLAWACTLLAGALARAVGHPEHGARIAVSGAFAAAGAGYLVARRASRGAEHDKLVRGTTVIAARAGRRPWSRYRAGVSGLSLAGQPLAAVDECKHFKLLGTTGTGKTTAIRHLLRQALERGDTAVFADPDGAYASEFYDPDRGDVLLNPFDKRSARWDPFAECTCGHDADQLARSLIADQAGDDRTWRGYARVLTAALIRQLLKAPQSSRQALHRLLVQAPVEELAVLLDDTAAAPYLCRDNARFLASVRAIAGTHLAILEHLDGPPGAAVVSIRGWMRERGRRDRCLFFPYSARQIATLRGAISAWMRLAIFETMELDAGDHRTWFVVDELDALGAIDGLKDALVRLRKFGGRCVLGFQSIGQVMGTYGRYDAQTIVENCGNSLILRCSSSGTEGTSQFASRLIGEREVSRAQTSRSARSWLEHRPAARTTVMHRATEAAVLPAEIEQLPDFAGYLKLASTPQWRRIEPDDWCARG
jgi:type IV secretory pathway TraG/TraD family ATPase VirD4